MRKGVTWRRKSFLSYVQHKINVMLQKSFEAVNTDNQRLSYECLKFTKCAKVYRNRKHLTGCTEKSIYVQSYPFSQILSHKMFCLVIHVSKFKHHRLEYSIRTVSGGVPITSFMMLDLWALNTLAIEYSNFVNSD